VHQKAIYCVDVHPDKQLIVSGGTDGVVLLSSLPDTLFVEENGRFAKKHQQAARGVAYSPNGTYSGSVGYDAKVYIWKAADHNLVHEKTDVDRKKLKTICFSPDEALVAVGGESQKVQIFKTADGTPLTPHLNFSNIINSIEFSVSGKWMTVAGEAAHIHLYQVLDKGEGKWEFKLAKSNIEGHKGILGSKEKIWVNSISFAPPEPTRERFASVGADTTVKLWAIDTASSPVKVTPLCTIPGKAFMDCVKFFSEGTTTRLVVGDRNGKLRAYEEEKRAKNYFTQVAKKSLSPSPITALARDPDPRGNYITASSLDGRIQFWAPFSQDHESFALDISEGYTAGANNRLVG
jgi:WD40 repeat protein